MSSRLFANFWLTGSRFDSQFDLSQTIGLKEKNGVADITAKGDLEYHYSSRLWTKFGFEQKNLHVIYEPDFSNARADIDKRAALYALYLQTSFKPLPFWEIETGLRANVFDSGKRYASLSPRFSTKYRLTDTINLKAATGRYHQYLNRIPRMFIADIWTVANRFQQDSSADHYILGYQQELPRQCALEIETYVKTYRSIYSFNRAFIAAVEPDTFEDGVPIFSETRGLFDRGDGNSVGFEVLLQKRRGMVDGWVGYSLSRVAQRSAIHSLLSIILINALGCGDPGVDIMKSDFEPKIIIQGYLFPHRPVSILLTRNFPLGVDEINRFDLLLDQATAVLTDSSTGATYGLTYNPSTLQYEYLGTDLLIDYGKTYHLDVSAIVEGKPLTARSTTTVPERGFAIDRAASVLQPLAYRQRDEKDQLQHFEIAFTRSPKIDFYILSILALDASAETFIYDNPYRDFDSDDVNFFMDDLTGFFVWMQNQPIDPAQDPVVSRFEIQWYGLPFYGPYRGIFYAAEKNFKDFFLTHSTVQDIDGNFHEPILHIDGDGVGVFGAAIVDTVYFEVLAQ